MKYLYFSNAGGEDAVDDILCMPVSKFRGFAISATDTTSLGLYFDRIVEALHADADNEAYELVDLVITAGKAKDVCSTIIRAINSGAQDDMVVVADDTNSVYLSDFITSVNAITIAS
jgi:hypothetical protein